MKTDKTNNIKISRHFNLQEFQCPCCKRVILHSELLLKIIKLRLLIKEPIYINSGYRCISENSKVGGVPKSFHLFGMAADISVRTISISEFFYFAEKAKFGGIGIYPTFLHVDVRQVKARWEG